MTVMDTNISMARLRLLLKVKGLSIKEFSDRTGICFNTIVKACGDKGFPMTNVVARMCYFLNVFPSEIVEFEGIDYDLETYPAESRLPLPEEAEGEISYLPLVYTMFDYCKKHNVKNRDIYDSIEPPRRIRGIKPPTEEMLKKAQKVRFGADYVPSGAKRTYYKNGLPPIMRSKLNHDRPIQLATVYEVCRFFRCPIDFVLGFK